MQPIPEKETLTIEFKSDLEGYADDELIDEIVGMANTEGGMLYLGVEDDGTPSGLIDRHKDTIGLCALVANKTVPSLSVRAALMEQDGITVMRIEIGKSSAIVASSRGRVLRRRLKADGTPENVPMYPFEMTSRLSDLRLLDLSAQPLNGAVMEDLDPAQIIRLKEQIRKREADPTLQELTEEELLRVLHMSARSEGREVPTLTGMLLAGREARLQELVPTMRTEFQVLRGTSVVLNRTYTKPLIELRGMLDELFQAYNPEEEMEEGPYVTAIPAFSARAFREGVNNAFAHRDYSLLGSVRIQISDNGLVISNPGGFVDGITAQNVIFAEPEGRNLALADAFKRIGLVERTGRGVDRIYEGSIRYGRPWPDYAESTSKTVRLFIPRAKADLRFYKNIEEITRRRGKPLSIETLLVLSAVACQGIHSEEGLLSVTHIRPERMQLLLEEMRLEGILKPGEIRAANPPQGAGGAKEKEAILTNTQEGDTVRKRDVVNLLGVSEAQAYRLLKQLQQEGHLEIVNAGRYAKYRRVTPGQNGS